MAQCSDHCSQPERLVNMPLIRQNGILASGSPHEREGRFEASQEEEMGMGNLEEGLRWLDQAEADMKTARDCLKDRNFYASAFFSQQAAEKALKGFLYAQGYRALITHSLTP